MEIGDLVVRKSYDKDITFKIIDIKEDGSIVDRAMTYDEYLEFSGKTK